MKIQKICLLACAFTSFNVFAAPPALNAAPAMGPGAVHNTGTPMSSIPPAPISGQPGPQEEAFLDTASEEKRKEEFLSEVVQDEQKIAQMAKEFDMRIKKIEDAFSSICSNATHHETGGSLNMPMSSGSKPAGGMMGVPVNAEHVGPPASQSPITPSGVTPNQGAFNTPSAPAPQK